MPSARHLRGCKKGEAEMKNENDVKDAVKKIMGPVRPGLWWYMPSAVGLL